MYAGLRPIALEKKAIATGSRFPIQLAPLPPKVRVRGLLLRALLTIVQGAGASAVTGVALSRFLASAVVGKRVRATGMFIDKLAHLMAGKDFNYPPGVPADAGTYTRMVELFIPWADLHQLEQLDTAAGARMYSDESLELEFADFATVFGANTTMTGTLKTYAVTEPFDGAVVASPTRMNYQDVGGQSIILPAGTYSHLFAYKETGLGITSAEISAVSLTVDGEQVLNRVSIDDLTCLWNLMRARGAAVQSASDTVPVAGEELTSEPGAAAAAGSGITVEVVPLIVTPERYKLTHLLHAESQVQVDFEGTLTSGFRLGYRMVEEQSPEQVAKAAAKLGSPHLTKSRPKASGKTSPSDPRAHRLLPKRLGA